MVALPWLLLLAAGAAPPTPSQGLGGGDGFVYPGQPGSEGISDYYAAYARRLAQVPKAPPGRPPALESLAWMRGCWDAVLRDYEYRAPGPMKILELGHGLANIEFTPDDRWLRIETTLPHRWGARYIGFDRALNKLVLQQVGNAGMVPLDAFRGSGWDGDRLVFGPAAQSFFGMRLTDRVTFVRQGRDDMRIVVEGRLASGRFVALDDMVLRRRSATICRDMP